MPGRTSDIAGPFALRHLAERARALLLPQHADAEVCCRGIESLDDPAADLAWLQAACTRSAAALEQIRGGLL